MNKSAFLKLIQRVSSISDQQTEELEKVAATFPYCQTAHLLLAKSAYDKGSMLSTQRLRRASSYATDRQLLKRVIYTSPALEPEPEAEETVTTVVEDTPSNALPEPAEQETLLAAEAVVPAEEQITPAVQAETEVVQAEENLKEVYTVGITNLDEAAVEYPLEYLKETTEEKLDSELALLFTFNSISTSSTDLLSKRDYVEVPHEVEPLLTELADHYQETAEALTEIDHVEDEPSTIEEEVDTYTPVSSDSHVDEVFESSEKETDIFEDEEDIVPAAPDEAEINYSTDEIDRLYAEDSLGYWMGSSRMGEVLQLKDDYTRSRPLNFHPELILEYSKTHELEKAIQPTANVLSDQLDIIDQFLKLNPRLKTMANLKLKPEPQEDLSLKSSKIKKGMASESLAGIFLKQGKTKKAVKIYEQLMLKYPEKKSYFAEQIEKLQNIT